MAAGDWYSVSIFGVRHHFIEYDSSRVIHYSGMQHGKSDACIRIDQVSTLGGCRKVFHARGGDVALQRALSRVGERKYCILSNNCEHFSRWCISGEHESEQVNAAFSGAKVGGTAGAVGSVVAVTRSSVAAAGVCNGLRAIGSYVGCGLFAGIALTALFPIAAGLLGATLAVVAHNEELFTESGAAARAKSGATGSAS